MLKQWAKSLPGSILLTSFMLVFIVPLTLSTATAAPQSKTFNDYTIHFNAFTSDTLQPQIAKAYNITRSKNRALLTISVIKKSLSPTGMPVVATISAKATNLTGQLKDIQIREIKDGPAIYYLSEFHVTDKEVLDFVIQVQPENNSGPYQMTLRQQFYTN